MKIRFGAQTEFDKSITQKKQVLMSKPYDIDVFWYMVVNFCFDFEHLIFTMLVNLCWGSEPSLFFVVGQFLFGPQT